MKTFLPRLRRSTRAARILVSLTIVSGCALQPTEFDDDTVTEPVAEAESELKATCFCKISFHDLTNETTATGVCQDLTGIVNKTYDDWFPQRDENQTDCNTLCTNAAAPYTGSQAISACACAAGAPNGSVIRAWSAVGTKEYKSAQQIGTLKSVPAQTATKCPVGWLTNTTNVNGGVTADGKCKKLSAQPMTIAPLPANGTPIGTYGFTWGNAVYAWGTQANGGAAFTTIITPALCSF